MTGAFHICCIQLRSGALPSHQVKRFLEPARAALQQQHQQICVCIEGVEFERFDETVGFWVFRGTVPLLRLSVAAATAAVQQPLLAAELKTLQEAVEIPRDRAAAAAHNAETATKSEKAAAALATAAAAARQRVLKATLADQTDIRDCFEEKKIVCSGKGIKRFSTKFFSCGSEQQRRGKQKIPPPCQLESAATAAAAQALAAAVNAWEAENRQQGIWTSRKRTDIDEDRQKETESTRQEETTKHKNNDRERRAKRRKARKRKRKRQLGTDNR